MHKRGREMSEFESVEEELKFMADLSDSQEDPENAMMFIRYLGHIRTLAAQRDEGLAREAELQSEVQRLTFERQPLEGAYSAVLKQNDALQQRLAEAEKLPDRKDGNSPTLSNHRSYNQGWNAALDAVVAIRSPGCADGEQTS
jgi:septal ring factor EnvC (AmiA/AmiB activator)